MPRKRRNYPAELEARVALKTLREEAIPELAARCDVHPNRIANWKKKAREQALLSFTGKQERHEASREAGIGWWMNLYDERRPHSSLDDRTPEETYTDGGAARRPGKRGELTSFDPIPGRPARSL